VNGWDYHRLRWQKTGAGQRSLKFRQAVTGIPAAMMGMLQATAESPALWHRLEKEGRLVRDKCLAKGVNQNQPAQPFPVPGKKK